MRDELLAKAVARWKFRARGPFEGAEQYRDAAVAFLETRDWAAAEEVRLGKPQAQWSADDVRAFSDRLTRRPFASTERPVASVFIEAGACATTVDALVEVAHGAFAHLERERRAAPTGELAIFAHLVTLSGQLLVTTTSTADRMAVLKSAARTLPIYGYVLVFDAFVHAIDTAKGKATKRDALMAHLGTREDRRTLIRKYTVAGATVDFDPETAIDLRATDPDCRNVDPYAELFVSVPQPVRPQ